MLPVVVMEARYDDRPQSPQLGNDQSLEYLLSTHFPLVLTRRVLSDGFLRFGFLAVAVYGQTFTAVTRVRIPSGTPTF
jgi:hypothetical protein